MIRAESCAKSVIQEKTIPPFAGERTSYQARFHLRERILQKPSKCIEVKPMSWHPRWPKD